MQTETWTHADRLLLLKLARCSIEKAVCEQDFTPPGLAEYPPHLCENGVCFVTLTMPDGDLRGCIGGLEAVQPLVLDVWEHAVAAAQEDYRFLPVRPEEVPQLHIEISCLSHPRPLFYENSQDLPDLLHPHQDGVILRDGLRRATFLPQVWKKLPDPCAFLSHLCQKLEATPDLWRQKKLDIEIYHVEEFHEENFLDQDGLGVI